MRPTTKTNAKIKHVFGFFTVLEHSEHGLFGGLLILDPLGRPLEFHCTAPIKANRAQEILYGPTLQSYLYGEQIGQTLLHQATLQPELICTDYQPALAIRDFTKIPVVLVLPEETPPRDGAGSHDSLYCVEKGQSSVNSVWRIDPPHSGNEELTRFQQGPHYLAIAKTYNDDRSPIADRLELLPKSFQLLEPFTRIREAIEEAQSGHH